MANVFKFLLALQLLLTRSASIKWILLATRNFQGELASGRFPHCHGLSMHILYRFHGWLIFVRVMPLFMFVWPYVLPHILCMQLVICILSHFIHIWYLGWPWSEHAHIIPISRMFDFSESYSPFHVCLTICPFAYLVYATSHLSFVAFYSYLVSWLAMIWACAYYTDFTDGWFLWEL